MLMDVLVEGFELGEEGGFGGCESLRECIH
jgi:hypothetical protein